MLSEALWLKNCENFLVFQRKNWGSSDPKDSLWKAEICYQQIRLIRPLLIKLPNRIRGFSKQKPLDVSVGT